MIFLPADLAVFSDTRLAILDAQITLQLKREIDRVALRDPKFARAVRDALKVEDEVLRRGSG